MKKNYLLGILGALIGGLIATIPWVLVYVYANMIYSILAIFVAMGALKGYQIFKGTIDKKLPIIIIIISLLSITIATLLIIPCLLMIKEDIAISVANLKLIYSNSDFITAMTRDFIISIVFTCLGISGVISSIKKQIAMQSDSDQIKIDLSNGNSKKERDKIKNIFLEKNATSEETAINIDEEEINESALNYLISKKIVSTIADKYYYSLEEEKKSKRKNIIVSVISILCVALLLGVGIFLGNDSNKDTKKDKDLNTKIENVKVTKTYFNYEVPDNYKEYRITTAGSNGWNYVPKKDLSGKSGYIEVYYMSSPITYSEKWEKNVKKSFEKDYDGEVIETNYFKTDNGLEVSNFEVKLKDYTDHVYYIFGAKRVGIVEIIDYNKYDSLEEDGKKVVESFTWVE